MRNLVLLLEKINMFGNAAAALTTVTRASLAERVACARRVGLRRRPGKSPENRGAAEERIIVLLIGVGIKLVLHALM